MNRVMQPDAVAVIGASPEDGKIGNSVMKNLINGGYQGQIYPIHPKVPEVLGKKAYKSVKDIPGPVDVAVFAIPAPLVAGALKECGEKKIPGAVLIPSGFAETGNVELQDQIVKVAREYNVRLMGPNIYGFYYTHKNLCATFCTPYDVKGKAALSSQSGGVGMAIIGFSRSAKMGVSAIVGLGNKSDIDEDDLLTFFEQDPHTQVVAKNSSLQVKNSDPILHNIHSYQEGRTILNIAEPKQGMVVEKKMTKVGGESLKCDVHNFMRGGLFVAENPYAAVTDADGKYELKDVPAGTYQIATFHEVAGTRMASVTVPAGGKATYDAKVKK